MTTQPISEENIYQVSLHIYDAFLHATEIAHCNFRAIQANYQQQILGLQYLALGRQELFQKLCNVYTKIDNALPRGYSVLHESNITTPIATESRRSPAFPSHQ